MVHVLSGQWPFPGEAVRVNPNNPNDVIGVTEFGRREEYINLIGNEHPLMTLIQECLSNSPSHRPTSSEVHQRVSAVAADHPPSFTNRVEMMERIKALSEEKERVRNERDRIKTLSEEKERVIIEKDSTIVEKNREIAETRREKDTITRENERISAELAEIRCNISGLRESHSIEVEALQIVIADMKADMEHLQATVNAKDKKYKLEQEAVEKEKQAMEERFKSERQALEHQHSLQLRALQDEHHTVKQAMEQQLQDQLESKMSELSAKDALISSKSSTIQSLQEKLGQALGTSFSKGSLSVFSPGVKLTFTECAKIPETISGLDQGIVIGENVYFGVDYNRKVFKYSFTEDTWNTLPAAPVNYARIGYLYKKCW